MTTTWRLTMSDLRDRIAAAVKQYLPNGILLPEVSNKVSLEAADAVIEALNLRTDQVGTLTRYVTEWIDHD